MISLEATEDVNISPWTEDQTTLLINLWGPGSVQAKLEGLLLLSQLYDITQYTLDDASAPTMLPWQPVRLVLNVAQSEQSQIRSWTLAKNSVDSQA